MFQRSNQVPLENDTVTDQKLAEDSHMVVDLVIQPICFSFLDGLYVWFCVRSCQEPCASAADVVDLLDSPPPAEKPNDSQSPAAGCLTLLDYPEPPGSPEQPAESLLEESQVEGLTGHSEIPATQKDDKDEESDDAGEKATKGAFQDWAELFLMKLRG